MESMKGIGTVGMPTKQGVGCSNHPGRTKPLQLNRLACEPSVPKLVDSNRESRPVRMEVVSIQRLSSGREHMLERHRVSILLNLNRFARNNLAWSRIGCCART